jgi:polynucleotide 5'-hydroxyl-kinase GRC3/NOL9
MSGVPKSWAELAATARDAACRSVYIVGDTDSGKTTLARWLLEEARGRESWYLDCDPGQSELGPPATVGLARWAAGRSDGASTTGEPSLAFIGSTSPARHLLQTLSGIGRLARTVPEDDLVVYDSSGFVSGRLGGEFQYNLVSLLRPAVVAAIDADDALRATLSPFDAAPDIDVRYLERHEDCGRKTRITRGERRTERFRRYFEGAETRRFPVSASTMHGMLPDTRARAAFRHRLCALLDRRQLVAAVAICLDAAVDGRNVHALELLAPAFDPEQIASVQFGSFRLAPDDLMYPGQHEQTSRSATAVP